jgi:hypothetical protein
MPSPDPAAPAEHTPPDQPPKTQPTSQRTSRATNRRTGRRDPAGATKPGQPAWVLGPPQTVPMSPEQYQQAVAAWTVLIASWWTRNPPEYQQTETDRA